MAIDLSGLPDKNKKPKTKPNIEIAKPKDTKPKVSDYLPEDLKVKHGNEGMRIDGSKFLETAVKIVGDSAKEALGDMIKPAPLPFTQKVDKKTGKLTEGKTFGDVLRDLTKVEGELPEGNLLEQAKQIPDALKDIAASGNIPGAIKDFIGGTAGTVADDFTSPLSVALPGEKGQNFDEVAKLIGKIPIGKSSIGQIATTELSKIPAALGQAFSKEGVTAAAQPATEAATSGIKGLITDQSTPITPKITPDGVPSGKVTPEGVDLSGLPEPTTKPSISPETPTAGPKGVTVSEGMPKLPTKAVKPIINENVGINAGKYGTGDLIPESKALEQSFKRQESASKTGFRAGKKEQKEITRLYKGITKPISEQLPYESKRQLETLQEAVKQAKTLKDLQAIHEKVKLVKEMGKARYVAIKEAKAMHEKLEMNLALKTLDQSAAMKPKVRSNQKPFFKKVGEGYNAYTRRPMRLADELDGGANFQGIHHNILIDQVNDGINKELVQSDKWIDVGMKLQKEMKLTGAKLSSERVINGTKYRLDEMLHIYAVRGNKENLSAIVFGNKIPAKDVISIINSLSNEEKVAADELVRALGKRYNTLRESFIEYYDGTRDLGYVENYVPIIRRGVNYNTPEAEMLEDYTQRVLYKNKYADKGFTKERVKVAAENQTEIKLGLFESYYEHVQKREHFIALGNTTKDLQRFVNNREWSEAVQGKFGDEYLKTIRRYVDKVGNPRIYQSMSMMAKAVWGLRKNTAIGYMGLNVLSAIKQPASWFLFLNEVGPTDLTAATYKLMRDFPNQIKFINEAAPQMKHRSLERELDEMRRVSVKQFEELQNKIGSASMQMLITADKFTASAGWLAVYEKMMRLGFAEDDAIRQATNAVIRTQGSALSKDLPEALTDERLAIFNQFQNFVNNSYNIMSYDIPMRASTGRTEQALLGGIGVSLAIATEWMITNGRAPQQPKDFVDMLLQPLDTIPIFGQVLGGARKGFEFKVPAFEAFSQLGKSIGDTFKGNLGQAGKEALTAAGLAAGIPTSQPSRTIGGAMDLASGETEDLKRLVYSKYVAEQGEEQTDTQKNNRYNKALKEGKDFKAFLIENGLA